MSVSPGTCWGSGGGRAASARVGIDCLAGQRALAARRPAERGRGADDCYGRGGTAATVTDAALVLGYLDAEFFLGGRMRLDAAAAWRTVAALADTLGIGVEEAAFSIFAVSNETMINAIKDITVSEGINPAEAVIVAGGGAAGLNIVPIARELACRGVIVPRTASVLSACGMQFSTSRPRPGRGADPLRRFRP